jgi:hypothetical protein
VKTPSGFTRNTFSPDTEKGLNRHEQHGSGAGQGNAFRAGRIAPELDNTSNRPFSFLISSI